MFENRKYMYLLVENRAQRVESNETRIARIAGIYESKHNNDSAL